MNLRFGLLAAAVFSGPVAAGAADYPAPAYPAPPAYGFAPAPLTQQPGGYCPSCAAAASAGRCKSCGHSLLGQKHNTPFVTNLCPGACFGYFQTQWRRWEAVCPMPYQGVGVSDAPKPPSTYLPSIRDRIPTEKQGGTLPAPRPVDPSTGMPGTVPPGGNSGLPSIPMPPGG